MLQDLYTPRGEALDGTPWDIYPRPQMRRSSFLNLNGTWDFSAEDYIGKILVPFCPESALSGVKRHFSEGAALTYRRTFTLPEGFNQGRVLLHFGAADQQLVCFVNGKLVGTHIGGYTAFTFDITDAITVGENALTCICTDDLSDKCQPYGKQTVNRGGMWYTPVSGIWQTVWLESVPDTHIETLRIENRNGHVEISIEPALPGKVNVKDLGEFALQNGKLSISHENLHLWSPEDPYLYEFSVETDTDKVESYFAARTIEAKKVNGVPRLCLNGKPYFFHGLLDQGYWPEGIYTPPAPESYADDILAMKALGFNTLRKHIKIEAEEFYYQCDKLGMVVFQDMVNNSDYSFARDTVLPTIGVQKMNDKYLHSDENSRSVFIETMTATVQQLRNHPCILYWTIFNEGWGQFDSDSVYEILKKEDDTRIIDSTSGWFRRNRSDVESLHIYFNFWHRLKPHKERPLVLSEFGGFALPMEGHLFNPDNAYGYKNCKSLEDFQSAFEELYRTRILPAIPKGLCGTIYTQVSDVEDEINGILTYDRKVCKGDEKAMQSLSQDLQEAIQ